MKIRTGFVSNSSSSSYVIAYDKGFFGDLKKFFIDNRLEIGCETHIYEVSDTDPFFSELDVDKEKLKERDKRGLIHIGIDREYLVLIELLKFLNAANGGDKLEIIYGEDE